MHVYILVYTHAHGAIAKLFTRTLHMHVYESIMTIAVNKSFGGDSKPVLLLHLFQINIPLKDVCPILRVHFHFQNIINVPHDRKRSVVLNH